MVKTLEGIRVVDFTVAGSGPSVTRLLAEYGAEIFMVEPLDGVNTRTFFAETDYYDTGKKSIPIDLKSPEGKEIIYKMIRESDVFVTNYRMKAIKKLGLDYETLRNINPKLIFATLTGYGYEGPEKDSPGYDSVSYWSEAGLLDSISDKNGAVLVPLTGYGDPICGKTLAMGICAALYHCAMTGEGMEVTTSLLADGVYQNHTPIIETQYGGSWPKTRTEPDSALMNTYQCRDGWFYLCADKTAYIPGVFRGANLPELANDPQWSTLEDAEGEKASQLVSILDKAFADCFVDAAVAALKRFGVPCYKVTPVMEAIYDEQALANHDWLPNVQYFDGRIVMAQASPIRFGDNVPQAYGHVHRLGEDSRSILRDMGFAQERIEVFVEKGIVVAE